MGQPPVIDKYNSFLTKRTNLARYTGHAVSQFCLLSLDKRMWQSATVGGTQAEEVSRTRPASTTTCCPSSDRRMPHVREIAAVMCFRRLRTLITWPCICIRDVIDHMGRNVGLAWPCASHGTHLSNVTLLDVASCSLRLREALKYPKSNPLYSDRGHI